MIVALCSLMFRAKIRKSSSLILIIIKRVISEVVLLIALLKTQMMDDAKKCGFIKTKLLRTYTYLLGKMQ